MRTIDFDLAELSETELRRVIIAASALREASDRVQVPALAHVTLSIIESIIAEQSARDAGRGKGTVRLSVDDFADEDPDDAERYRLGAVVYLGVVRDDHDEPDVVRRLFASVMADLSDPTPTERQVEIARLERLSGIVQ
jgi:hypothetical protein